MFQSFQGSIASLYSSRFISPLRKTGDKRLYNAVNDRLRWVHALGR